MAEKKTATATVSDLRGLSASELQQRIVQARKDLGGMRLKASQGALEQPHRIRFLRRDIARMLTLIGEQSRQPAAKAKR